MGTLGYLEQFSISNESTYDNTDWQTINKIVKNSNIAKNIEV